MARVQIDSQPWGAVWDAFGNSLDGLPVTLKIAGTATDATHYSAVTGGSATTGNLETNDGLIKATGSSAARFIESGSYDLTIDGVTRRVEAVPGSSTKSPWNTGYFGNATSGQFEGYPNIPIQIMTFHGNLGGLPVTGQPQGWAAIAKYFAPTTADSAQAGSSGAFLVDTGTPFTQTLPLTGNEGDACVQGGNTLTNKAVGVAAAAEAQDTAHIATAIGFYASEKSASDAGATIDFWTGMYVENPLIVGTVTDYTGVYSRPRIQTETSLVIGLTQAATTASVKGMTMYIQGTNATGQPSIRIVKKSGSNDDVLQITDSGSQPQVLVNSAGQLIVKTAGGAHSGGSAVGAMIAMGNITTPPSTNFSGGTGGFLYVESGALKFRGGSGTVTTVAPA